MLSCLVLILFFFVFCLISFSSQSILFCLNTSLNISSHGFILTLRFSFAFVWLYLILFFSCCEYLSHLFPLPHHVMSQFMILSPHLIIIWLSSCIHFSNIFLLSQCFSSRFVVLSWCFTSCLVSACLNPFPCLTASQLISSGLHLIILHRVFSFSHLDDTTLCVSSSLLIISPLSSSPHRELLCTPVCVCMWVYECKPWGAEMC